MLFVRHAGEVNIEVFVRLDIVDAHLFFVVASLYFEARSLRGDIGGVLFTERTWQTVVYISAEHKLGIFQRGGVGRPSEF